MSIGLSTIGMNVTLHTDLDTAYGKVVEALKTQGFGVITDVDVQAAFKEKLNEDFRPYRILGVCHPQVAFQALSMLPDIGLLIPCNVSLSVEAENTVMVSLVDAEKLLGLLDKPDLAPYAKMVRDMMYAIAEVLEEKQ